jgi:ribosomal protein S18 acetylase RimI-like enzyme
MPLPGVTVRPATADDVYRLADIVMQATKAQGRWPEMSPPEETEWRDGFAEWSRQNVHESSADNVLSVILKGREIIGRLRVTRLVFTGLDGRKARRIQLAGIQLAPSTQGQGIGTSVIRDLQAVATQEGIELLIGVEKDNAGARRLYERLGCSLTDETDDEYLLLWSPPVQTVH